MGVKETAGMPTRVYWLLTGLQGAVTLTATLVDAELVQPPATVTVTVYVPELEEVADEMVGFCNDELKPLGPVHE